MLCLRDSLRDDDPSLQRLLSAVEDAYTLTEIILAAWQVARVLTVRLVEAVLAERARRPLSWPRCPACGGTMRSKGCATRQVTSLFGPSQWRRRVGRCPQGCAIPQVAPFDEALGVQPRQRSSGELQALGCALAVFVPFATAARLLGWDSGSLDLVQSCTCVARIVACNSVEAVQHLLAGPCRSQSIIGELPEQPASDPSVLLRREDRNGRAGGIAVQASARGNRLRGAAPTPLPVRRAVEERKLIPTEATNSPV